MRVSRSETSRSILAYLASGNYTSKARTYQCVLWASIPGDSVALGAHRSASISLGLI